jgi:hypothetical protein
MGTLLTLLMVFFEFLLHLFSSCQMLYALTNILEVKMEFIVKNRLVCK